MRHSVRHYAADALYPENARIDYEELVSRRQEVEANARDRGVSDLDLAGIETQLLRRRSLLHQLNRACAARKQQQQQQQSPATEVVDASRELRERVKALEAEVKECEGALLSEAMRVPNWSHPESPPGLQNKVVRTHLPERIRPFMDGKEKETAFSDHMAANEQLHLVDFEGGVRAAGGAHFPVLNGVLAALELGLLQWVLKRATERGFKLHAVPDVVRESHIVGSGFHPRTRNSADEKHLPVFTVIDGSGSSTGQALAGTSEVAMAGMLADQTVPFSALPLRWAAWSHCFRSEVGHHSASSRGLYRLHQFTKAELFAVSSSAEAPQLFTEITDLQSGLLQELDLPFRVLEMGRGELGGSAFRKWDHEVWMPGRRIWGEVMSTSWCTDYQSRRLNIRAKGTAKSTLVFPHTLNGTACAIPRMLMALIEWGWDSRQPRLLKLPRALQPFIDTFYTCSPSDPELIYA